MDAPRISGGRVGLKSLSVPSQTTGAQVEGLSIPLVLGAQAAGAEIGNSISWADALFGATTISAPSQAGDVLRRAVP